MMTIATALQRLTELVSANQHLADQKHKSREPETFNGSDPEKLQQFLVLLKLNFEVRPHMFLMDAQHVNFTLSPRTLQSHLDG